MAENPAASRQPVLKPLSEVNHEPGAQTISTVVKILNAIMEPLTTRDWRYQEKVPQTGGVIFVPNHISNADPLAVGGSGLLRALAAVLGESIGVQNSGHRTHYRGLRPDSGRAQIDTVEGGACCRGRGDRARPRAGDLSRGNDQLRSRLVADEGQDGRRWLALTSGCPVVPIGQWGAQELMPGRKPRFPKLFPRKTTSCHGQSNSA